MIRPALCMVLAGIVAFIPTTAATQARNGQPETRALREMQIYKVKELGLQIWVENQPPWSAQLSTETGHPTFVAESPDNYHPPTVMTFASWPKERPSVQAMSDVATSAIRRASQNFGLNVRQARAIQPQPATYGVLQGYEASFYGVANGVGMDVMVFVGQAPGKFPVALTMYTLRGKIGSLAEQRRRSWTMLKYL